MQLFPINEIFLSIQGEGYFTGKPVLFIRVQGCEVGCRYCDTKYAQKISDENSTNDFEEIINKKEQSKIYAWIGKNKLIEYIKTILPLKKSDSINHIVITGGEPFLYDISTLTGELINIGYYIQIETSGCYEIPKKSFSWITLSPKKGCLESSYKRCNEIKFIVTDNTDFDKIRKIKHPRKFLQPESCLDDMVKKAIDEALKQNCKISLQAHKYLNFR